MASEEASLNLLAHREVLRSFSCSNTETSVEWNLCCAHTHHNRLVCQQVTVENEPEMAWILDAERQSIEQIIQEEQVHRMQVAAPSQMQLLAMKRVDAQEKELQRHIALLLEHQALLNFSPERPHKEATQVPTENISQFRCEAFDYLSSTIDFNWGAASKTDQVHDLSGSPTVRRDSFEGILADAEVQVTPQGGSDSPTWWN